MLGCKPEECFIGGNASLTLMYDLVSKGLYARPCTLGKAVVQARYRQVALPAPGYDRHFKITESFGFGLITIPMTPTGRIWIWSKKLSGSGCQGHVVRAEVFEPRRHRLFRRDHRAHRGFEARRARFCPHVGQCLLHPRV